MAAARLSTKTDDSGVFPPKARLITLFDMTNAMAQPSLPKGAKRPDIRPPNANPPQINPFSLAAILNTEPVAIPLIAPPVTEP